MISFIRLSAWLNKGDHMVNRQEAGDCVARNSGLNMISLVFRRLDFSSTLASVQCAISNLDVGPFRVTAITDSVSIQPLVSQCPLIISLQFEIGLRKSSSRLFMAQFGLFWLTTVGKFEGVIFAFGGATTFHPGTAF